MLAGGRWVRCTKEHSSCRQELWENEQERNCAEEDALPWKEAKRPSELFLIEMVNLDFGKDIGAFMVPKGANHVQ
jgi:hypothetical protein